MHRVASVLGLVALAAGCHEGGPTVVVEHELGESVLVKNVRFLGCVWPASLTRGHATVPETCLSGTGRVYYDALDTVASPGATFFPSYQTSFELDGDAGEDLRVVLTPETEDKDVTAPGPFGH